MDSQIELCKEAFSQRGNGFDLPVLRGNSRYQYAQGFSDVLLGIVRFIPRVAQFFKPVAMERVQTFLKAGSEAIKKGATVKDVIKYRLKPTVGAVLGATFDQIASKLIEMRDKQNDAPPPNPPIDVLELIRRVQVKSGAVDLYIRRHLNVPSIHPNSDQLFIIFLNGHNWR